MSTILMSTSNDYVNKLARYTCMRLTYTTCLITYKPVYFIAYFPQNAQREANGFEIFSSVGYVH